MTTRSGRSYPSDPNVRTVQLGQFSDEHAETIAAGLEEAGISWWYKQPGTISRIWEWGVRLYVDRERITDARTIAATVTSPADAGD